jgi:hypothetical protein
VVERAGAVVEAEQERADELVLAVLVPAEPGDDAVRGARVLDLEHRALARLIGERVGLGHHAVEPGALEALEPVGGDGAIARHRRDVDRRLDAGEGLLEAGAALGLRAFAEVLVAEREQIPRDVARGVLGGEHLHARCGGVDAQEHRLEVELAVVRDHDLAVEDAAIGQALAQRDLELGEVAAERLEIAALDVDVVAGLVDERAEAVPLGFEQPAVAVGDSRRELRQHRLERRLEGQGELHGRTLH